MKPPGQNHTPEPDYMMRCPLLPQYRKYEEDIMAAVGEVLSSGHYINGPNVSAFEAEFAAFVGCGHGVGVNSGTDALIMALWSLDLDKGDEVITTPFTFFATYTAIRQLELTPVFVDIHPETFLMDIDKVPELVSPRTRVVMPVHLFGNVVDVLDAPDEFHSAVYFTTKMAATSSQLQSRLFQLPFP